MRELRDEKLDFWIQNSFNVLFIGHYGIGKTNRVLDAFKRNNLKFKYFSAPTMDPWVDFVGVPKTITDASGEYLDYVLPRDFRDDTIEAIYIDEMNRGHKKVRNAIMELVQFKSINGRPFNKLRLVWAAINPEDEGDYQVEPLDKSQKDRFQVHVQLPYEPSFTYFSSRFNSRQAKIVIGWWQNLTEEQQMQVSPRRLEYALQMYNLPDGDIKDVLPHSSNPSSLLSMLRKGPVDDRLKELFGTNNIDGAKKYLQVENNYTSAISLLTDKIPEEVNQDAWQLFFLPLLPTEKLASLLATDESTYKFIVKNFNVPIFSRVVKDIISVNTDRVLVRRLKKDVEVNGSLPNPQVAPSYFSNRTSAGWTTRLANLLSQPLDTTPQRMKVYEDLTDWIPKVLNLEEAVNTLGFMNLLAERSHTNTLGQFRHLIGVVNHCIEQIHRASGLCWNEILTNYGTKFNTLLAKMDTLGMTHKILQPVKKAN